MTYVNNFLKGKEAVLKKERYSELTQEIYFNKSGGLSVFNDGGTSITTYNNINQTTNVKVDRESIEIDKNGNAVEIQGSDGFDKRLSEAMKGGKLPVEMSVGMANYINVVKPSSSMQLIDLIQNPVQISLERYNELKGKANSEYFKNDIDNVVNQKPDVVIKKTESKPNLSLVSDVKKVKPSKPKLN